MKTIIKPANIARFLYLITIFILIAGFSIAQDVQPLPESPEGSAFDQAAGTYNGFYLTAPQTVTSKSLFTAFDLRKQLQTAGSYSLKFKDTTTGQVTKYVLPENTITFYYNSTMGFDLATPDILSHLKNRTSYKVWLVFKDKVNKETYKTDKHSIFIAKSLPVTLKTPEYLYNGIALLWNKEWPDTATTYRMTIYEASSGTPVYTMLENPSDCFGSICSVDIINSYFTAGKTYNWQVIGWGFEGTKAKSEMGSFTIGG